MSAIAGTPFLLSAIRWLSWAICYRNQAERSAFDKDFDDAILLPSMYPKARRDKTVVDNYHGTMAADPYRWMEDLDSEETKSYIAELNKTAKTFFEQSTLRDKFEEKLMQYRNYKSDSAPDKRGDFYYTYHYDGTHQHPILYQSKSYEELGEVFFDVNKLSEDGLISIGSTAWFNNGKYVAFGLSEKGSDYVNIMFMENNGNQLGDKISDVRYSTPCWLPNSTAVVYTKLLLRKSDENAAVAGTWMYCLLSHEIGTNEDDVVLFEFSDRPHDRTLVDLSNDSTLILITRWANCSSNKNRLYYHDLKATNYQFDGNLDLKPLFTDGQHKYDLLWTNADGEALVLTDNDAPMFKLIRVKLDVGEKDPSSWRTVIPEDKERLLIWVYIFGGNRMLADYLQDGHTVFEIFDLETGQYLETVPLPLSSAFLTSIPVYSTEVFFTYESLIQPRTNVRLDYAQEREDGAPLKLEVIEKWKYGDFDSSKYETKQIFYESKDGTKIPMFIVAAKDVKLDSNNPTLLEGYGGFGLYCSLTCDPARCVWLQHFNGVYAFPCIRGGGEYGRVWHDAGRLDKQQNSFDDFQAAAEWLINNKYTRPERLAIYGSSQGGLLVAVCAQQAPHLFGAVIADVGLFDMYRRYSCLVWEHEYGDPSEPEHFEFLKKYSPMHNIRIQKGKQWPAMLLMTGDHDDRVSPWQTYKYIAQLYHVLSTKGAKIQKRPILARIEADVGHGAGTPLSKSIKGRVDMYAFLGRVLKLEWKD
ncbi:Prolyl endopeptidase [Aphelenchoides besseyi]|nr:Prolyl endopeptidase [Aphelenchoides besseyi]